MYWHTLYLLDALASWPRFGAYSGRRGDRSVAADLEDGHAEGDHGRDEEDGDLAEQRAEEGGEQGSADDLAAGSLGHGPEADARSDHRQRERQRERPERDGDRVLASARGPLL